MSSDNLESTILHIQNVALFLLAIPSSWYCINHIIKVMYLPGYLNDINEVIKPFDSLIPFVFTHASIDIFLTKNNSLKMHHLCVMGVIGYNYYYSVAGIDRFLILCCLLKTEASSIFYVLKYWIPKRTLWYNINNLLFYIGFLKFRIIDMYFELMRTGYIFTVIEKYSTSNILGSAVLFSSCYGLYLLNLYWFFIINKIAFTKTKSH